jgi:hypothetical protein
MAMSEPEVKTLVGLTLAEAGQRITDKGSYLTVMSEDGVSYPVLTMFDPDRVCVHVAGGKVTAATVG